MKLQRILCWSLGKAFVRMSATISAVGQYNSIFLDPLLSRFTHVVEFDVNVDLFAYWFASKAQGFFAITIASSLVVFVQFCIPSGSVGKKLVGEMAHLFRDFATESALEVISTKAVVALLPLLLQKPHAHISCLQRQLALWELFREGTVIQRTLNVETKNNTNVRRAAHRFSSLMMQGKVQAALKSLSDNQEAGPLKLEDTPKGGRKTVKEILNKKHPPALPPTLMHS